LVCLLGFVLTRLIVMRMTRAMENSGNLIEGASDAPYS
jgi:hypothetical protein